MNYSCKSLFSRSVKWEWLSEKPKNEVKTQQFYVFSNKKQQFQFKALIKSGSLILKQCKNDKIKYVDIKNCRMYRFIHNQNGDGIKILTENFQLEFYGQVEEWFEQLKLYCIQTNFHCVYMIGNLIGKGTYGKVYFTKYKSSQQEFAVKVFEIAKLKTKIEIDAIVKEIEILRIVQHQRVIKLLETFETDTHIFVVYELLKGGELKSLINEKRLSQDKCITVLYKLIDALSYIHGKGIIHRDIKPENLIFRNTQNLEEIIIADFGLADFYRKDGEYLFTRCGTAGYLAPELIKNQPYDYKVDVYSLGIVFYMLLNGGQSPFESKDFAERLQSNLSNKINLQKLGISQDCFDLLQKMIDSDPQTRITAQQAKLHPLFQKQHQQLDVLTMRVSKPLTISLEDFQKVKGIQTTRQNKHNYTFSNSALNSPVVHAKNAKQQHYSTSKFGKEVKPSK